MTVTDIFGFVASFVGVISIGVMVAIAFRIYRIEQADKAAQREYERKLRAEPLAR